MNENKDKKIVLNLYGLFAATLVLSVLPYVSAAALSFIFFTLLLVLAYMQRGRAEAHSLLHNHARYIIRSLWITAFMALITMIIGSVYIFAFLNSEPFFPCAQSVVDHAKELADNSDIVLLLSLTQPCMNDFMGANYNVLLVSGVIVAGPPLIYISYRFIKGLRRAAKGYRLADPLEWL